jgi:signal transduction histidine kinase
MVHSKTWPDETRILYAISNKLTQASTPAEWLEAVSDYARDNGATSGVLVYIERAPDGKTQYTESAAVWTSEGAPPRTTGERLFLDRHDAFTQAWMSQPERPLLIPDAMNCDVVTGKTRTLFSGLGIRGMALLPLNIKGRWIGSLIFNWSVPFYFNEDDLRIFTAIIQQAGPVIDSMRLYAISRERAARAEHLLAINAALSRATNEGGILAALARYADQYAPSSLALSYTDSDAGNQPVSTTIMAVWRDGRIRPDDPRLNRAFRVADFGLTRLWQAHPNEIVFIEDTEVDPRVDERTRRYSREYGVRVLTLIPLFSYGQWQGLVTIEWAAPHTFSRDEHSTYPALLQTLPSVVASRRAYLAAEQARDERELLYRASAGINAARSYQAIVDSLERLDMNELSIALWVWENYDLAAAQYMELVAKSQDNAWELGARLAVDSVPMVRGYECSDLIVVEDTADRGSMDEVTAATTEGKGYRSLISVPLCLDGRFMGLLGFECKTPRAFTEREKRLAVGIGELVSAAVDRIRLKEETDRLNLKAQEMAALEERNRLARELHDSVSQALYGIALGTRTAQTLLDRDPAALGEPLDYVLSLAEAGLSEMRALIFELRPEMLENEGLTVALKSQAASLQARHGLDVQLELCVEPDIALAAKEALYRIAREALHNIVKHARARQVTLRMDRRDDGVALEIADDGAGFDPGDSFPGHLGLRSMRERAARLNGTFQIESAPGQGTRIAVSVPSHG